MCNFLINTDITTAFEVGIRELAFSLTPGGSLLVLGATGGSYPQVYAKLDSIVSTARGPRLKRVLERDLQAHAHSPAQDRIATHVVKNLAYLQDASPGGFGPVRAQLGPDVRALNASAVRFPRFTIHAYKREGPAAISLAERQRRGRRNERRSSS